MADTTENKKYLVNVESNLDKYAADAAKAAEEVDRLTVENIKLKGSTTASKEEVEKSNAALRSAKKEYTDAKKLVDLQTQANNSNINSRKQLAAIVTLEQRRLGELANTYTINSKGVRVLSQDYINQVKRLKEAKDAVISYDKAQADGRSSVGLYSEAIQGATAQFAAIPGPIGAATTTLQRFSKVLLANPIVLIITAIIGVLAGLLKAFKSTDDGGTEFAARMEQIKAILDVLRQRAIAVTDAIGHIFRGEWKEAGESFKEAFTGIAAQMRDAANAGYEYIKAIDDISNAEQNYISQAAENRNKIAKLEFTAQDRSKTIAERKKALQEAIAIGEEETKKQQEFARRRLEEEAKYLAEKNGLRMEDVIGFTLMTDEEQKNANESLITLRDNNEAKLIEIEELYAKWIDLDTKFYEENKRNVGRLTGFDETTRKENEAALKKKEEDAKKALEILQKEADERKKQRKKERDEAEKAGIEAIKQLEEAYNARREAELINQENIIETRLATNEWVFDIERDRLQLQYEQEIAMAKKTGADIQIINEKYAAYKKQLDKAEVDAKLSLYANFAGNLAQIFGENTAIGKAAAIASATIDTYAAATKALATYPPPFSYVAAAAAVAAGIANVKKIVAVKSGLPGEGSTTAPTLSNSAPRATAPLATIFTQPQLSQGQLNSVANQPLITADDIANALKNLPPPIVTVEDINAKARSKSRVEVRANI